MAEERNELGRIANAGRRLVTGGIASHALGVVIPLHILMGVGVSHTTQDHTFYLLGGMAVLDTVLVALFLFYVPKLGPTMLLDGKEHLAWKRIEAKEAKDLSLSAKSRPRVRRPKVPKKSEGKP